MSLSDLTSDLLTRLRNASMVRKRSITMPHSKALVRLAAVFAENSIIASYEEGVEERGHKILTLNLRYVENKPVFSKVIRESKPGRRLFTSATKRFGRRPQHSFTVLSTSSGVMPLSEAFKQNIGGEVICTIW